MLTEVAAVGSAVVGGRLRRRFSSAIESLEPIVTQFGYDPFWFVISVGVVMVEDGSIHPPVGMSIRYPGAGAPMSRSPASIAASFRFS